jgi:putative transposase
MKRTNTFAVRPLSDDGEQLLRDLLNASAALWNEVNYQRLMRYNDEDGFEDEDVWDADTGQLEGRYKGVLGTSTAQQVIRKNSEAWRAFFRTKDKYHDPENTSVTEHPEPPGFWGNKDDGRKLHTVIRNTSYTVAWDDRSRLEILVGSELKDRYDHTGRLRLEIAGEPSWAEYENQGRLDLWYDETDCTFRASQPVTVSDDARDTPLADETAALDIGANNLVACTTTTGEQYLYDGSRPFQQFRETSDRIAELKSKLDDQRRTSSRIDSLYDVMYERRDHAQDALVRHLVERLYDDGASTVYVGDVRDVLETHWGADVNAKTHNFWAFRRFIDRLECVCEEYGIEVEEESEEWTTQECPECGEREETERNGDVFRCGCGFEGHADLKASKQFLERETGMEVRLMAQPVCLKWDNHDWRPTTTAPPVRRANTNEERTDRSTHRKVGKVASVESA